MNTLIIIFIALLIAYPIWTFSKSIAKKKRRTQLLAAPMPKSWAAILKKRFPAFERLPEAAQARLVGLMQVFLDEKRFEACGDLDEVTEEMRVLVAAQACLLLIGIPRHNYFTRLKSILIYPKAYTDRRRRTFDLHHEEGQARLGESWDSGSVVLSWQSVKAGAIGKDDGINVVYHEFAHQLDQIDDSADGAPPLPHRGDYVEWAAVFSREYEELVKAANSGRRPKPLLDTYGATNPAEFFAVTAEAFFEMPKDLKDEHPELYEQMSYYFGVDPAAGVWGSAD